MKILIATLACVLLGACGGAQFVKQDARSGRIHVDGGFMHSMRRARVLMVEHCHGRFEVTRYSQDGAELEYTCIDERVSAK